ncbi:MAG TPA: hypothetical protein PKX52_07835, partial [Methanomassiliicoccaceae archaeon]|nr:hypothetical protein [Methanomassiliicoccaceae archaeon]
VQPDSLEMVAALRHLDDETRDGGCVVSIPQDGDIRSVEGIAIGRRDYLQLRVRGIDEER